MFSPFLELGLNPYDVRKTCNRETDGPLCYKQMGWIETWMNDPENKKALGVDPSRDFESCNMQVNQAFLMAGDGMHNSALMLPELIEDGIRLLVYAGEADYMCNFIVSPPYKALYCVVSLNRNKGNEAWLLALENDFQDEFVNSKPVPWVTMESGNVAGTVRSAGGKGFTAGNVTFVAVHDAG